MTCPQIELNQTLVPFIQEQLSRQQILLEQELRGLLMHLMKCQSCRIKAIGMVNGMLECGHPFSPTLIARLQAIKEELQKFQN